MLKLSWNDVRILCQKLAEKIEKSGRRYHYLLPVPMGGYPVAVILGEAMNLPIYPIKHSTINSLIVDDLIDSGRTLSKFATGDKAVLFVKNHLVNNVNYYARECEKNEWISFPWEKDERLDFMMDRVIQFAADDDYKINYIKRRISSL